MNFAANPEAIRLPEYQRDQFWRRQAWDFARAHPGRVLELAMIKFARFWSPWPNESRFRTPLVVAWTTSMSLAIYGLAVLGSLSFRRQLPLLAALWMPAVYFCVLHLVFVSSVRYRVPVMPLLCLLAGVGLASWLEGRRRPAG